MTADQPARFDQSPEGEWITVRVGDAIDVVTLDVWPLREDVIEYAGQHGVVDEFVILPDNLEGNVYGVMVDLENGRSPVLFIPQELVLPMFGPAS